MQQQQRQMPTSQLLKRFIPYFYKYRKLLVIDLMAAGLTTVCELVLPLIVRRITNGALGMAGELSTGLILRLRRLAGHCVTMLTATGVLAVCQRNRQAVLG